MSALTESAASRASAHAPAARGRSRTTLLGRIVLLAGATLVLFAGAIIVRTVGFRPEALTTDPAPEVAISAGAAERLAGSLRFRTISHEDSLAFDGAAFQQLHAYLESSFPRVHSTLTRETIATHSLLYTWQGTNPTLKPILLMGHLDVVPVEPGTEERWEQNPFSGLIVDSLIWGRGAIDNKSTIVGTLEAVEMLLSEGFRPARTVYLSYGHDEEVGGTRGAQQIAALLRSRGVQLEMVLDEGGVIGDGVLAGIAAPTALVGIAEKGFVSIELTTRSAGGHSSLPPQQSAVGILSAAIARLEANQMPARLEEPTRKLFTEIGPRFPLAQRVVFANLWATEPLVLKTLEQSPTTNAMVRTTTAATMFQAGTKDNVLPTRARAVVNFRILTGDSVAGVVKHVRRVIDDSRIEAKPLNTFTAEPSAVSSTESPGFRTLQRTIASVVPDAIVAPYLVVVVTDARYYQDLSSNVFRFLPLRLKQSDLQRMHGINERIAIADYEKAIRVYRQLILNAAAS